jgi:hypothetical protein
MTKRVALLIIITNFVGYYVTECACGLVAGVWPSLPLLMGTTVLCATVNSAIALAIADIPLTLVLCYIALPTVLGAGLAHYLWPHPMAFVLGGLTGFAATPLFLPAAPTSGANKGKTANSTPTR